MNIQIDLKDSAVVSVTRAGAVEDRGRARWTLLDYWLLLLMFGPMLGSFYPPETYFRAGYGAASSIGPLTPISLVAISVTVIALYFRMKAVDQKFFHTPLIYIFVAYVFVGLIWSTEPQATFQRALRLLPAVGLGIVLPQWYGLERFFKMMSIALLFAAISSIFMSLFVTSLGSPFMGNGYGNVWKGALATKNAAGLTFNFGFLFAYLSYRQQFISSRFFVILAGLCLVMIVASQSLTPLVCLVVSISVASVVQICRSMRASTAILTAVAVFLSVTVVMLGMFMAREAVAEMLGRDLTFTGRTELWAPVAQVIADKPFFGHGYNFWSVETPARQYITDQVGWGYVPPEAHNAWLDILLQLGLPGFICVFSAMMINLIRSVRYVVLSYDPISLFPLALTIFLMIYSVTEACFTEPAITGWLFLTLAATQLNMMHGNPNLPVGSNRSA